MRHRVSLPRKSVSQMTMELAKSRRRTSTRPPRWPSKPSSECTRGRPWLGRCSRSSAAGSALPSCRSEGGSSCSKPDCCDFRGRSTTSDPRGRPLPRVFMESLCRPPRFHMETLRRAAIDGAVRLGGFHAGCRVCSARVRGHFADGRVRRGSTWALRRPTMIEPIFGLIVAVGLGLYLLYTLLRPEKF